MSFYRAHEWVEHAHSEGGTTRKRLRHVQLRTGIIVIVLIQELYVRVIACENI